MQLTQFLSEAAICGEAIKIQILPSVWTSQGKKKKKTLDRPTKPSEALISDFL